MATRVMVAMPRRRVVPAALKGSRVVGCVSPCSTVCVVVFRVDFGPLEPPIWAIFMAITLVLTLAVVAGVERSRRFASTNGAPKEEAAPTGGLFSRDWKIPAALGFSLIGFLQWHHLNNPTDEERKAHPAPALRRLPGHQTAFEETMATERQLQSLKLFPYRAASRLWGQVHDKELCVPSAWCYHRLPVHLITQGALCVCTGRRGSVNPCTRRGRRCSTASWTR